MPRGGGGGGELRPGHRHPLVGARVDRRARHVDVDVQVHRGLAGHGVVGDRRDVQPPVRREQAEVGGDRVDLAVVQVEQLPELALHAVVRERVRHEREAQRGREVDVPGVGLHGHHLSQTSAVELYWPSGYDISAIGRLRSVFVTPAFGGRGPDGVRCVAQQRRGTPPHDPRGDHDRPRRHVGPHRHPRRARTGHHGHRSSCPRASQRSSGRRGLGAGGERARRGPRWGLGAACGVGCSPSRVSPSSRARRRSRRARVRRPLAVDAAQARQPPFAVAPGCRWSSLATLSNVQLARGWHTSYAELTAARDPSSWS